MSILCIGISNASFHIAERTLLLWRGEYFVSLIAQQRNIVLPSLYRYLIRSENVHWHPQVRVLANNVLKLFKSMDDGLYKREENKYLEDRKRGV